MEGWRKGKRMLYTIIAALLAYQIVQLFISWQVAAFAVNGALLFFLYKGYRWAKITLAAFMLLTVCIGLSGLAGLADIPMPYPFATALVLAGYTVIGAVLVFSRSIADYMDRKRNGQRNNNDRPYLG